MAREAGVSTPFLAAVLQCSLMVAIATITNDKEWKSAALGSFVAATILAGTAMEPVEIHAVIVAFGGLVAATDSRAVAVAVSAAGVVASVFELGKRGVNALLERRQFDGSVVHTLRHSVAHSGRS